MTPNFTDAFFYTIYLPAILLQLFFFQVRKIQAQLFFCSIPLAISASPVIPVTSRKQHTHSRLVSIALYSLILCHNPFCAYPLMQDAVSAIKIPVCLHFRLCPVFT